MSRMGDIEILDLKLPRAVIAELASKGAAAAPAVELIRVGARLELHIVAASTSPNSRRWKAAVVHVDGNRYRVVTNIDEVVGKHVANVATELALASASQQQIALDELCTRLPNLSRALIVDALRVVAISENQHFKLRDAGLRHVEIERLAAQPQLQEQIATRAVRALGRPEDVSDMRRFLPFADAATRRVHQSGGIGTTSQSMWFDDNNSKNRETDELDAKRSKKDDESEDSAAAAAAAATAASSAAAALRLPTKLADLQFNGTGADLTWTSVSAALRDALATAATSEKASSSNPAITANSLRAGDIDTREKFKIHMARYVAAFDTYDAMRSALDKFEGISELAKDWLGTPPGRHAACAACRAEMREWFHKHRPLADEVAEAAKKLHAAVAEQRAVLTDVCRLHNVGVFDSTW